MECSFSELGWLLSSAAGRGRGIVEVAKPIGFVLADEADAPAHRLASISGHPALDQGVEDAALWHGQLGGDRGANGREQAEHTLSEDSPGDLACEGFLRRPG